VTPVSGRWPLACFAALGVFWGAWAALLPDIKQQVAATDAEFGLALLGAGAGALPAMLVTGRLWRRFGWWLLPASALLFALACFGPMFASTPWQLTLALAGIGAASGALDVAMNAAVSDVEAARSARLMYGAHALFSLAVLLGSVTTGVARELGGRPTHVLVSVAAVLVACALGAWTAARSSAGHGPPVAAGDALKIGLAGSGWKLFAVLAVLCATGLLIEDAIQNWSALHLERTLGTGPAIGGAAPGVFAGAMFVGRSLGQRVGDRLTERALVSGGALGGAIGLAVVAAAPTPAVALGGLVVTGAGIALVAPALYARAGRLAEPRSRGAAIATLTFFGYMGFLVGPALMGGLAAVGGLRVAIAALAVLAVALGLAAAVAFRGAPRTNVLAAGEELLRTSRG
jgi:MFS family permease